jgi:hypothetical protein
MMPDIHPLPGVERPCQAALGADIAGSRWPHAPYGRTYPVLGAGYGN